jgi:hypothetical protein
MNGFGMAASGEKRTFDEAGRSEKNANVESRHSSTSSARDQCRWKDKPE